MIYDNCYLNQLYNDLLSNSPQTIALDIPNELGSGRITQTKIKHGVILSDWELNYRSDMNVQGCVSKEYIKSYNLLGEKSEELTGNFKRSRNTSLAFERKMTPWTMGLNILYGIGIAAIFGLAVFLERSDALSLAYVFGVLLFVFDLFGPLKALYGEASRLTVMNAALDRIEAVLEEPELPDTGKQHLPVQAHPGQPEVQFHDVAFAYHRFCDQEP